MVKARVCGKRRAWNRAGSSALLRTHFLQPLPISPHRRHALRQMPSSTLRISLHCCPLFDRLLPYMPLINLNKHYHNYTHALVITIPRTIILTIFIALTKTITTTVITSITITLTITKYNYNYKCNYNYHYDYNYK